MTQPQYHVVLDSLVELYIATSKMVERVGEQDIELNYALSRAQTLIDELNSIGYFKNG